MTMSSKDTRRKKQQRKDAIETILKHFKNGPIHSLYKAYYKIPELKEMPQATLRRDLKNLRKENYLKVKKGPRGAKTYSLTFEGLLFGLKIGAFDPEEIRTVRIVNNIDFPIVKTYLPIGNKGIRELKAITNKMEKLYPKTFYNVIRKFDIDQAPKGIPAWGCVIAALVTMSAKYLLDPEAVGPYLEGTKVALKFKNGTKWVVPKDYSMLLSIMMPVMPKELQNTITKKLKELGVTLNNSEELQDMMRKVF